MRIAFLAAAIVCAGVFALPASAQEAEQTNLEKKIVLVAMSDAEALPAPSAPLTRYARIVIEPMTYSPLIEADNRKKSKAKDFEARFFPRIQTTLDAWNAKGSAADAAAGAKQLIIKPRIQSLQIVSGGARFWVGALSGDSNLSVSMQLIDAASGTLLANPTISKSSNGFAGAWTFGSTDNNLMNYVAETANQYIIFHLNGGQAEAPATAEVTAPAEAASPPAQ